MKLFSLIHQSSLFGRSIIKSSYYSTQITKNIVDVAIIGGGIVGTATARELLNRYPKLSLAIIEKESELAKHQSSHNSGVIHSGIYYKTGSHKARLCVKGVELMYSYCAEKGIPAERCGKLIVAKTEEELPRLHGLFENGKANGVQGLELVGPERMKEIEPWSTGVQAIWSPNTGIVSYGQVAKSFADDVVAAGGQVFKGYHVNGLKPWDEDESLTLIDSSTSNQHVVAKKVIVCAGMEADRLAKTTGGHPEPQILPVRGDFLILKKEYSDRVKGNIYPVPNPALPFLGVHLTKRIDGRIIIGPNAVLAFSRNGYSWKDINLGDVFEYLRYRGFHAFFRKFWKTGFIELYKDLVTTAYLKDVQEYVPDLNMSWVERGAGPSGVRAQALGPDGSFVDDFVFEFTNSDSVLNVRNAPSPAATSSMAIAEEIIDQSEDRMKYAELHQ